MSPNESSHTKIGLHLIGLLAKDSLVSPQTTHTIAKAIGCSSQTDSKSSMLKTISTKLIESGVTHLLNAYYVKDVMQIFMYTVSPNSLRQTVLLFFAITLQNA